MRRACPALVQRRGSSALLVLALLALPAFVHARTPATSPTRAADDTVFAGDWEAQGRFLFELPSGSSALSPIVSPSGDFTFAWVENRDGRSRVVLKRFDADGRALASWPADGVLACADTTGQVDPDIASDGGEGLLVSWLDARENEQAIYVQHLLASGSVAPGWPADGNRLLSGGTQLGHFFTGDGAGGAFAAWYGAAAGEANHFLIYHMAASGDSAIGWSKQGWSVTDPSFTSLSLENLVPELDGTARVAYSWTSYCSGHGCYPSDNRDLCAFGPQGRLTCGSTSRDVYWRTTLADGHFGTYSLMYWAPEIVLEHFAGAGYWGAVVPGMSLVAADASGGLLVQIGARFARYATAGTTLSAWGGLSGISVLPAGWSTSTWGAAHDGADGFYFAWMDGRVRGVDGQFDLYATLIRADGTPEPGWPASGLPIVTQSPQFRLWSLQPFGPRRALALWFDESSGARRFYAQRLSADQPVPAQVSLVSAVVSPSRVKLEWYAPGSAHERLVVQRRNTDEWTGLGEVTSDVNGYLRFEDAGVTPGERYEYRLTDGLSSWGHASVLVPPAWQLALSRPLGNPVRDVVRLHLTLPDDRPVSFGVFDVGGRRVAHWSALAPGAGESRHEIDVRAWAPGVYLCRLESGGDSRTTRFIVAH